MNCNTPEAKGLLSAFVDEEVTEAERAEVAAHLESCAACRRHVAELRRLDAMLHACPVARASERFESQLHREVARKPARAGREWATPLAAAAAILLIIAGTLIYRRATEPPATPQPPVASLAPNLNLLGDPEFLGMDSLSPQGLTPLSGAVQLPRLELALAATTAATAAATVETSLELLSDPSFLGTGASGFSLSGDATIDLPAIAPALN